MWVHAPILLRPCEILKSRLKVLAMMMISVASLPERLLLLGPLTHSHTDTHTLTSFLIREVGLIRTDFWR